MYYLLWKAFNSCRHLFFIVTEVVAANLSLLGPNYNCLFFSICVYQKDTYNCQTTDPGVNTNRLLVLLYKEADRSLTHSLVKLCDLLEDICFVVLTYHCTMLAHNLLCSLHNKCTNILCATSYQLLTDVVKTFLLSLYFHLIVLIFWLR